MKLFFIPNKRKWFHTLLTWLLSLGVVETSADSQSPVTRASKREVYKKTIINPPHSDTLTLYSYTRLLLRSVSTHDVFGYVLNWEGKHEQTHRAAIW